MSKKLEEMSKKEQEECFAIEEEICYFNEEEYNEKMLDNYAEHREKSGLWWLLMSSVLTGLVIGYLILYLKQLSWYVIPLIIMPYFYVCWRYYRIEEKAERKYWGKYIDRTPDGDRRLNK